MQAKALMVLGTTSGAGKSWLATALCRWAARQGLRVAPFKAQNMSNNARVVPTPEGLWGEIGSAQYFQALAAGVQPDVRMNPVLLKPESDVSSQVVVMGQVRPDYAAVPWRERSEQLWPPARQALQDLMAEQDLVVIEGAGSPAEINLHHNDFVNMRTALQAQAACLLVTDIDRGGAFAHLYGTHQLLPAHERECIKGFVLNRFRGDATLLAPGPQMLQEWTGVPTVGVLPMWLGHGLPEEDGLYDAHLAASSAFNANTTTNTHAAPIRVAVLCYPRISNLDEFQALRQCPGVRLRWARQVADLDDADWVILPGSKHTQSDLQWLRQTGLDQAVIRHAKQGKAVLGICGGLQMLGEQLSDPLGVDGGRIDQPGLGLLGLRTQFDAHKLLRPVKACFAPHLAAAWSPWQGLVWSGYEIRHGRTDAVQPSPQIAQPQDDPTRVALVTQDGQPIGWQRGSVLGLYAHGLFESGPVLQALFGSGVRTLDQVMDGLADFIEQHMDMETIRQWIS